MAIPLDYAERTYAGVLGKIIGVYLGRPFEGWTYERIMAEPGEINYYVHEKLGVGCVSARGHSLPGQKRERGYGAMCWDC